MNKEHNNLDKFVKAFSECPVPQGPSDDLIAQTLDKIEQTKHKTNPLLERIFTMKPITKIAAAAIIIVGLSAVFLLGPTQNAIALSAVYDKVQQARAYVYQMSITLTGMGELTGQPGTNGTMEMEMEITISQDYGMKIENHMKTPAPDGKTQNITQLAYLLPEKRSWFPSCPNKKCIRRLNLPMIYLSKPKSKITTPVK